MSKIRYKIKAGNKVFIRGTKWVGEIPAEIAKQLLATGQYDEIIEVIEPKKKKQSEE